MKKRILSMLLVLALVLTMIPASALAETINDDNVFLMQSGSGKCTLTSAVMMLRHNRRKRRLGNDNRINARLGRVDKRHGHEI